MSSTRTYTRGYEAQGDRPPCSVTPVSPKGPAVTEAPEHIVDRLKARQRVPVWTMPVVAGLPLWGLLYFQAVKAPPVRLTGPVAQGSVLYAKCASCHGTDGGGNAGYKFVDNSVWLTFPTIEQQIRFVYNGTAGFRGLPYGAADRPGGFRVGGARKAGDMPPWGSTKPGGLSDGELVAVICHERHTLGSPTDPTRQAAAATELATWCSPDGKKWIEVEERGLEKMGVDISAGKR
jgi:mono/diheme cytochrome c family protein